MAVGMRPDTADRRMTNFKGTALELGCHNHFDIFYCYHWYIYSDCVVCCVLFEAGTGSDGEAYRHASN